MTQTQIDPKSATVEQIIVWLAEQPCPMPWGWGPASGKIKHAPDCTCNGTGLAFEWASKPCQHEDSGLEHDAYGTPRWTCYQCRNSGRVPKALTTDDLWEHGLTGVWKSAHRDFYEASADHGIHGEGETLTLAGLRAVAAKAGMQQGQVPATSDD